MTILFNWFLICWGVALTVVVLANVRAAIDWTIEKFRGIIGKMA